MQTIPMMNVADLAALFRRSLFAGLQPKEVASLHAMLECIRVEAGECIRQVGDRSSTLYVIGRGRVRLTDPTRRETLVHLGSGDAFGLLSIMFPGEAHIEVYAEEEATFVTLDAGNLRMIEVSNPALAVAILRAIRTELAPRVNHSIPVMTRICMSNS